MKVREALPTLVKRYGIRTIVDVPCGDFHWMKEVKPQELVDEYWGFDIVPGLARRNQDEFGSPTIRFGAMDIVKEIPPTADLILCRHLLFHLPLQDCLKIIANFKKSGSRYVLITNDTAVVKNREIAYTGSYRAINLAIPPFKFPKSLDSIVDSEDGRGTTELSLYDLLRVPSQ
jgi:hypothetical protein